VASELDYARAVADVLASDQRSAFLAFLVQELCLAGRNNYSGVSEADDATRIARFASLNEALHVLGNQLATDAGRGNGYPDADFAEALRSKAAMYDPDDMMIRVCLSRALERVKDQ
jgi:hypothetical protein